MSPSKTLTSANILITEASELNYMFDSPIIIDNEEDSELGAGN